MYCRIGWQLKSDESWSTELTNSRTESNILTRLIFYLQAGKLKGNHWWKRYGMRDHRDWPVTIHAIANKCLEWIQLLLNSDLWRNEEDLVTESLLSQSLSFKTYKMQPISPPYSRVNYSKNKNLRYWFKATADTGNKDSRLSERNSRWSWNEAYITIRWGTASRWAKPAAQSVTPIVFTCGHWSQTVRYKFVFDLKLK